VSLAASASSSRAFRRARDRSVLRARHMLHMQGCSTEKRPDCVHENPVLCMHEFIQNSATRFISCNFTRNSNATRLRTAAPAEQVSNGSSWKHSIDSYDDSGMMMVLVTNSSHSYIIPVCLSTVHGTSTTNGLRQLCFWAFGSLAYKFTSVGLAVDKKVDKKVVLAAFGQKQD
jgi:hypothetical protein